MGFLKGIQLFNGSDQVAFKGLDRVGFLKGIQLFNGLDQVAFKGLDRMVFSGSGRFQGFGSSVNTFAPLTIRRLPF